MEKEEEMTKAIIEFNLPEEEMGHLMAIHSHRLCAIIEDIDSECRNYVKYDASNDAVVQFAMKIREYTLEKNQLLME